MCRKKVLHGGRGHLIRGSARLNLNCASPYSSIRDCTWFTLLKEEGEKEGRHLILSSNKETKKKRDVTEMCAPEAACRRRSLLWWKNCQTLVAMPYIVLK